MKETEVHERLSWRSLGFKEGFSEEVIPKLSWKGERASSLWKQGMSVSDGREAYVRVLYGSSSMSWTIQRPVSQEPGELSREKGWLRLERSADLSPRGLIGWGKEVGAYVARAVGSHCSDSNEVADYITPF